MIEKIGHYALTTPGSIYDEEAMTALELAGRTAAKVNECVEEVNKIPATISNDVQQHIEGGTFDRQIDEFTGKITDQVKTTEMTLGSRLDNLLGSVEEGGTSMDAEVIDMRVGANGKQYTSAGTAVRDQFTQQRLDHDDLARMMSHGENAINPLDLRMGYYFASHDGNKYTAAEWATTPFIPCAANEAWYFNGLGHICVWDKFRTFLRGFLSNDSATLEMGFNTGADAAFITVSVMTVHIGLHSLGKGNTLVPVTPYMPVIKGSALDEHQLERARYIDLLMEGKTMVPVEWELGGFDHLGVNTDTAVNYNRTAYFTVPDNVPQFFIESSGDPVFYVGYDANGNRMTAGLGWETFSTVSNTAKRYRVTMQGSTPKVLNAPSCVKIYYNTPVNSAGTGTGATGSGKQPYQIGWIPFKVPVNQTFHNQTAISDLQLDTENFIHVDCILRLPTTYTQNGKPSKLVMICHGAGRGVTGDANWTTIPGYVALTDLLVNAGYAVFDCNGYRNDALGYSGFGCSRMLEAYRKAYDYVTRNYNVDTNFSIYGFSLGGLTALNLALNRMPNIKCLALGSPVVNLYNFGWERAKEPAFLAAYNVSDTATDYPENDTRGFDPYKAIMTVDSKQRVIKTIPPIKIWAGSLEDSNGVDKTYGTDFVLAARRGGTEAYYREVSGADHNICWGDNAIVNKEILMWIDRFNY